MSGVELPGSSGAADTIAVRKQLTLHNRLQSLYPVVYRQSMPPEEAARLAPFFIEDDISALSDVTLLRTVIAATDRQLRETPFVVRFGPDELKYVEIEGFQIAVDSADCAVASAFLRGLSYEPELTQFVKQTVKPGMSVIDIGANIGYFSMLTATLVGPTGSVMSFEPNSENCRCILLGAARNGFTNLHLRPVSLSTKTGHQVFSVFMGSNGGFVAEPSDALTNAQTTIVPTFRFDDLAPDRVDFIKIDVEGAEYLVMQGAAKTIERDRPIITSEFSPWMLGRVSKVSGLDYLDFFRARGYRAMLLGRTTGAAEPIDDIEEFVAGYGHFSRIEDLAFIPLP